MNFDARETYRLSEKAKPPARDAWTDGRNTQILSLNTRYENTVMLC